MSYSDAKKDLLPSSFFLAAAIFAAPSAADPTAEGRTLATSGGDGIVACVTCHGAQGEGMAAAGFPYLAGQGEAYLALQLQNFASGERQSPVMEPIAKGLDAAQIEAVSAFYSGLPKAFDTKAVGATVDTYPDQGPAGAWLANRGDWANEIPACIQCHGPGGVGVGEHFPALAGLPAAYLTQQLVAWKEKTRAPGPLSLMGDIARRMSDTQIKEVAEYFAGLPESAKNAPPAAATKGAQ